MMVEADCCVAASPPFGHTYQAVASAIRHYSAGQIEGRCAPPSIKVNRD